VEAKINRLKQLKENRDIEKEDTDDVCSETDDEAENDTEAQVMDVDEVLLRAWTPSPDNTRSTRIGDQEKLSENRTSVARRSQPPDIRKRSRIVVSDEESEESAGAELKSPPKRKSTRSSAKSISAPKEHPPSGQKTKKSDIETLNLSSDDNEPLETLRKPYEAAAHKKSTPPKYSRLTKHKDTQHEDVNSPNNSKIRNISSARRSGVVQRSPERNNMQEDGNLTLSRLLDVGNASRRKDKDFNDESQPDDLEERCGNDGVGGMGNVLASGHPAQGSRGFRGESRKSTSSHHDGAASHDSDAQAPSSLTQVSSHLFRVSYNLNHCSIIHLTLNN